MTLDVDLGDVFRHFGTCDFCRVHDFGNESGICGLDECLKGQP